MYEIGDYVFLRDDLVAGESYGPDSLFFNPKMMSMKNDAVEIRDIVLYTPCTRYAVRDKNGEEWFLNDEMIDCLADEQEDEDEEVKRIKGLGEINGW